MLRVCVVSLVLAAGCIDDHYRCAVDSDCDLGAAGRCELDQHCTQYDASCATRRRYTEHSGAESGACLDDHVDVDPCAPGQPPAKLDACTTNVCNELPACCTTGWTDACVELAQQEVACDLCDTQIALVANRGGTIESWVVTWDGSTWTATLHPEATSLSWLAPAPGTTAPRLFAVTQPDNRFILDGGAPIDLPADHHLADADSVAFDRDGRDTFAVGYVDDQVPAANQMAIVKLPDLTVRELGEVDSSQRLSWGDYDHDAFPDAVGGTNARYTFLDNAEPPDDTHIRILNITTRKAQPQNLIPGAPAVRSIDWADFDGDGTTDVIAFGSALRIHLGANVVDQAQLASFDCDPPSLYTTCTDDEYASLSGGVVSKKNGTDVLFSVDYEKAGVLPTRNVYRITIANYGSPKPVGFTTTCSGTGCIPIRAIFARDLDGDHKLDVIAIDAQLDIYVMLATQTKLAPVTPKPIATQNDANKPFSAVRISVTGAPR